jgi:hypothetical protein
VPEEEGEDEDRLPSGWDSLPWSDGYKKATQRADTQTEERRRQLDEQVVPLPCKSHRYAHKCGSKCVATLVTLVLEGLFAKDASMGLHFLFHSHTGTNSAKGFGTKLRYTELNYFTQHYTTGHHRGRHRIRHCVS